MPRYNIDSGLAHLRELIESDVGDSVGYPKETRLHNYFDALFSVHDATLRLLLTLVPHPNPYDVPLSHLYGDKGRRNRNRSRALKLMENSGYRNLGEVADAIIVNPRNFMAQLKEPVYPGGNGLGKHGYEAFRVLCREHGIDLPEWSF